MRLVSGRLKSLLFGLLVDFGNICEVKKKILTIYMAYKSKFEQNIFSFDCYSLTKDLFLSVEIILINMVSFLLCKLEKFTGM